MTPEDVEDVAAEILLHVVADDYALLRRFRGKASLATYLTVVGRRVCVREIVKRNFAAEWGHAAAHVSATAHPAEAPEARIESEEEVLAMLEGLNSKEADIVRMYHLDGKSYHEISTALDIAENSIGPTLHRAREKLRRRVKDRSSV